MSRYIHSIISHGADGIPIDIECHLANSLPNIVIVGAASRNVDEAKERIRGAFTNSNIVMPRKRISINLAPADVPKDSSSLDLPIAMAILNTMGVLATPPAENEAFIGELGLDGSMRPVRGIIGKLIAGRRNGIQRFYIPAANLEQAGVVPGIELVPVDSLRQLYEHCNNAAGLAATHTGNGLLQTFRAAPDSTTSLQDIVGQAQAKRALEIAAAGGHNLLLNGPPGTGKSLLAKALASLLPPLSHEEVLEVTHLHSLSGHNYEQLVTARPVRAPHHSASFVSVVGGGSPVRPGEVSLAHRGVLFFDELPEFQRATIESLRQPLEDKMIVISRAKESVEFPANFIFVATANPCPCGYYGTNPLNGTLCDCTAADISRYKRKLSGPLLDRVDLCVTSEPVEHARLLDDCTAESDYNTSIIRRVLSARAIQSRRFGNNEHLNSDMDNRAIKSFALPAPEAVATLNTASKQLRLSARAYMRSLRVARTIADLAGETQISAAHISEALRYRPGNSAAS